MPTSRNRYNLDDPKVVDQLTFRLRSSIEAMGGRLKLIGKTLGVDRVTVWRWIHRLGLTEHLDAIRAQNVKPRREKPFRWLMTYQPDRARETLRDVLWRNDGILDAVAVEMRCSPRTIYYRIDKLGLWPYTKSARAAADRKRQVGVPEPSKTPEPRAPYIYPLDT